VVETPELGGDDADPAPGATQDEADLPGAQDGDDRVGHSADPDTGQVQRRHFPPVRQLEADDLAALDTEFDQRGGEPLGELCEFAIGDDVLCSAGHPMGDDRHLVRLAGGVGGELLPERHRSSGLMTGSRPVSTASR
jgi:hypothetical protein